MALLTWLEGRRWYRWLNEQRRCGWCRRRLGGNPFAYYVTHGICPRCQKAWQAEAKVD